MTSDPPSMPERDPKLDIVWRAHSTEVPPGEVDAAILAAAHREVASRPAGVGGDALAEAREPSRWWWGLAAAATIGAVAFGLVQLASLGRGDDPTKATDLPPEGARQTRETPARPVESPSSSSIAIAPHEPHATPVAVEPPKVAFAPPAAGERRKEPLAAPATPQPDVAASRPTEPPPTVDVTPAPRAAPKPAPAPVPSLGIPAPPTADRAAPSSADHAATMAREPAPAPTSPNGSPAAKAEADAPAMRAGLARAAVSAESTTSPAVAEFVRRIRELHDAGRLGEAARELVAFRKAYPDADAQLPPALREWAATVRK